MPLSNAAEPNVAPDAPCRGPACGSVALSEVFAAALIDHAAGKQEHPPTMSASPAASGFCAARNAITTTPAIAPITVNGRTQP